MDRYERQRELRAADPDGLRSDNELEHQVEIEDLHERIAALPDATEQDCDLKQILSDIVGRIEVLSS